MVIPADVAINTQVPELGWRGRAYPQTKRLTPGLRYGSCLLRSQYLASARWQKPQRRVLEHEILTTESGIGNDAI